MRPTGWPAFGNQIRTYIASAPPVGGIRPLNPSVQSYRE